MPGVCSARRGYTLMHDEAHAILARCALGTIPPGIALMQLCLVSPDEIAVHQALDQAMKRAIGCAWGRLSGANNLRRGTPGAFALVKTIAANAAGNGDGCEGPARWAKRFDAAAKISPEASVALYSLGRLDLLEAATDEVVTDLRVRGVLGRNCRALEIGCGIGRFVHALSGEVTDVTGLDVSVVMLAEARKRCANLTNVRLVQGDGWHLSQFDSGAFDLTLAVDVFPYLVAAGEMVAKSNFEEVHRVLRPGGRFVILNYSYRGPDADRQDVSTLARQIGFRTLASGARHLRLWDGALFDLERMP